VPTDNKERVGTIPIAKCVFPVPVGPRNTTLDAGPLTAGELTTPVVSNLDIIAYLGTLDFVTAKDIVPTVFVASKRPLSSIPTAM
jgi:hypothetical protein